MPLKKKNRLRRRIIFWALVLALVSLMIYAPKDHEDSINKTVEYELY